MWTALCACIFVLIWFSMNKKKSFCQRGQKLIKKQLTIFNTKKKVFRQLKIISIKNQTIWSVKCVLLSQKKNKYEA